MKIPSSNLTMAICCDMVAIPVDIDEVNSHGIIYRAFASNNLLTYLEGQSQTFIELVSCLFSISFNIPTELLMDFRVPVSFESKNTATSIHCAIRILMIYFMEFERQKRDKANSNTGILNVVVTKHLVTIHFKQEVVS
jgi:hypothetical protein